jgi:hypothetical protein
MAADEMKRVGLEILDAVVKMRWSLGRLSDDGVGMDWHNTSSARVTANSVRSIDLPASSNFLAVEIGGRVNVISIGSSGTPGGILLG